MTLAILAIVSPLIAAAALALLGRHLLVRVDALGGRLESFGQRLDAADQRFAALATTLNKELGTLRATNEALARQVERLAADVVQREVYRGGSPRQANAIEAVRGGRDVGALIQEHGLSLDEAELLVSLYGDARGSARESGGNDAGTPARVGTPASSRASATLDTTV